MSVGRMGVGGNETFSGWGVGSDYWHLNISWPFFNESGGGNRTAMIISPLNPTKKKSKYISTTAISERGYFVHIQTSEEWPCVRDGKRFR